HVWQAKWTSAATLSSSRCCVRPDAPKSALRVPTTETAVFALHAGDGRADYRHSKGPISSRRRPFHVRSQGWRHEDGGDDYLRRRLDTAYLWDANHPHGGNVTAPDGKCLTCRWRRECAAWSFEYSGRHGHGRVIR